MSTLSLQLLKIPGSHKKGALPYGPRAYVGLKSYSAIELPIESGKSKATFHTLSSECVTLSEIECEIKRLTWELETIRKQAKKFFEKEREKSEKKGK